MPKRKKSSGSGQVKNRPSNLKQLYWLLGILIILLLMAKTISFFMSINHPMGLKPTGAVFAWDNKSTVNIVIVSPKSEIETNQYLLSYNPKEEKITILDIDPLTYTEVPKGYGTWKVGSIYKLGQDQVLPQGGELLEQSISKLVGLPIDGLVILKKPAQVEDLIAKIHSNRLELLGLLTSMTSDLTMFQSADIFWNIGEVRSDKVTSLSFLQSNVTESKLLPDSSRVLGVNAVKLDLFIRDNLSDDNISQEGKSIAIYNATSHPGLTNDVSRQLTNMGGDVIFATSAQNPLEKTQVVFAKQNQGLTADRLIQIFAPSCPDIGCRSNDPKVMTSRADINIVLGEDYYREWNVR